MTITQETLVRLMSIQKMFAIMTTVKFQGGDWDDALTDEVKVLPQYMPGITEVEMEIIHDAFSCPRAASDQLDSLREEFEQTTGIKL